jgi:NAD(P)H-nitrite reductase large subunit
VLDDDPLVCNCLAVRESEILHAIRSGADSVGSVGQYCEAGTGCTSCHDPIRVLLRDHARIELAHSRAPKSLRQLTLFDDVALARRSHTPSGSHKR